MSKMKKQDSYCSSLLILFVAVMSNASNNETIDFKSAVKLAGQSWFPEEIEFNKSCLAEDCPALNNFSLCPARVDVNTMNGLLGIICSCMRGPICGVTLEKRPAPYLRTSVDELMPGTSITGYVTVFDGACHLSNVSNMRELELVPGQTGRLPLHMYFHTPSMRVTGQLKVELHFPTELLPTAGQQLHMNIENVTVDATYRFYSTISVNQSSTTSPIEIEFRKPILTASYEFCGMDMPDGLPNIVELFKLFTKDFIEKSEMANLKAKLLRKLFQCAIDIVSKDCLH